jgi:hypothetical protein
MSDIRRKVELFFCRALSAAMPGRSFLPSKGGTDLAAEEKVVPPFVVVQALEPQCVLADPATWQLEVTVTCVSHIGDSDAPAHSGAVGEIVEALRGIPRGYNGELQLLVHGIDLVAIENFSDEKERSRGDTIRIRLGCSG